MKRITSILLISLLILTGCTAEHIEEEKEVVKKVYTKTIEASAYSNDLTLSGNVVPTQMVKLSFKIPGVVSNVLVNEGDVVKEGQPIATMEQGDYLIRVKASQAELEAARLQIETEIPAKTNQAKAQYELTKIKYDRVKALFEQGAVSQSQLDEISTKLIVDENTYNQAVDAKEVAETKLQMAEASLDLANANISDTTIYSPIDGVILQKIVASGETTSGGHPIVVIGEVNKVWAEIGVSDEYINALRIGQKSDVYIYGIDKTVEGIIDEIAFLADTKTRTFPVKILLNNPNGELKPGMITKVNLNLSNKEKMLIPLSSVLQLSTGSAVYVYSEETQTVSMRMIETGEIVKDKIEVIEGLELDEKIVIEGQFLLREGEQVVVEELIV
ncbi:efflux transporter, RND family, MFP subunit [Alkaliphilus metalliredigens QYMF]|uniref:Efflux transporter, RND family, MFP subunit n=1 Tax=Alkaliphilus metalliredigens (strain QYMF) TaxID=293826 RepID=A6TK74_ALKMQ|nr:efflux RND transporter periplasmic adaptor subunit [Alkaliphilus metalliredigens]ABR46592.1 efflux transporter, RND family, MFP subunit [Alkaliphilus metalliredigens QYMF]